MALKLLNISRGMQTLKYIVASLFCFAAFSTSIANKPELKVASSPVSCFGKTDGEILINLSGDIAGPYQIIVIDSTSKNLAKFDNGGKLPCLVKNLGPGNYKVLYYFDGKTEEQPVRITSPNQLKANVIKIVELKGQGTSVIGTIEVNPSGGNLPYNISWSENAGKQTGKTAKDLPKGIYQCTIDDSNHCGPVSATFFLYDDEIQKYNVQKNKK
jgi:hypothetical protein